MVLPYILLCLTSTFSHPGYAGSSLSTLAGSDNSDRHNSATRAAMSNGHEITSEEVPAEDPHVTHLENERRISSEQFRREIMSQIDKSYLEPFYALCSYIVEIGLEGENGRQAVRAAVTVPPDHYIGFLAECRKRISRDLPLERRLEMFLKMASER